MLFQNQHPGGDFQNDEEPAQQRQALVHVIERILDSVAGRTRAIDLIVFERIALPSHVDVDGDSQANCRKQVADHGYDEHNDEPDFLSASDCDH